MFKKEKKVKDEGLEDEYDEEKKYEILRKRRQAIEELAATLETEKQENKRFSQKTDEDFSLDKNVAADKDFDHDRNFVEEAKKSLEEEERQS